MANDYFRFKTFTIKQDKTAMKVCTDSCILGAFAGLKHPNRILDIGTGTGLLAIMLAQRHESPIDAVEIDEAAADQARENVKTCPWSDRIEIHHCDIQEFTRKTCHHYDLIVCNPPFFTNHLVTSNRAKNLAIHNEALPYSNLLKCVKNLMTIDGHFFVMLPMRQGKELERLGLQYQLFANEKLEIRDNENSKVLRVILNFQNKNTRQINRGLNIKATKAGYTKEFNDLLKPYYLNLY